MSSKKRGGWTGELTAMAVFAGLFCLTFGETAAPKKWFPGHYLMNEPDEYETRSKGYRILHGKDGALFKGSFLYVTWGQIETRRGVFHWEKIDGLLDGLPPEKKLIVSLSWQAWAGAFRLPCPEDMLTEPAYDGGFRKKNTGAPFSTIHMPATMTRYLAFVEEFAKRYDSDDRLALVLTAEIPYENEIKKGGYVESTARTNILRLTNFVHCFRKTPVGILGAWWSFGGKLNEWIPRLIEPVIQNGGGMGGPDINVDFGGHFVPYWKQHAGKCLNFMGMEYRDWLPEVTGPEFPQSQLAEAGTYGCNFIWWHTSGRPGNGKGFDRDFLPYLRKHPMAGIRTQVPENLISDGR